MKLSERLTARATEIRETHQAIKRGEDPRNIIPTGLKEFDRRGGIKRKQSTLFAGDSGCGKSLWALHITRAAAEHGYKACVVSMEDPAERNADRTFAHDTDINSAKMLAGELTDEEVERILHAAAECEWAERVDWHEGVRTPDEALELFAADEYDLGVLDYLSAFPHGKNGRERNISDFMWGYTKWAQDTNAAAVAFAQLNNRPVEEGLKIYQNALRKDDNAEPRPEWFRGFNESDLMWCTDAGRNAKELGFMQRPARIMKRLGFPADDNVMEFNFPKRNWGAEGVLRVGLDLKTARFYDLEPKKKEKRK